MVDRPPVKKAQPTLGMRNSSKTRNYQRKKQGKNKKGKEIEVGYWVKANIQSEFHNQNDS